MATEFDILRARILHEAGEGSNLTQPAPGPPQSQPAHARTITTVAQASLPSHLPPPMTAPEHAELSSQLADVRRALAVSLAENQQIRYEQNELLRLLGDQTLNRHLNTQHVAALQRLDESHARKLAHSLQVASDAAATALERGIREPTRLLAQSRRDHALTQARLTAVNLQLRGFDAVRGKALTKLLTGVPISTLRRCSKNGWYKGKPGPKGPGADDKGEGPDAAMDESDDESLHEGQEIGAAEADPGDAMEEDATEEVPVDDTVLARADLHLALQDGMQQPQQQLQPQQQATAAPYLQPVPADVRSVQQPQHTVTPPSQTMSVNTLLSQQQQQHIQQQRSTSSLTQLAPAAANTISIQHVLAGLHRHRKTGPSAAAIAAAAATLSTAMNAAPTSRPAPHTDAGSSNSEKPVPNQLQQQPPTASLAHPKPQTFPTSLQQPLLISTLTPVHPPPQQPPHTQLHTATTSAATATVSSLLSQAPQGSSSGAPASQPLPAQARKQASSSIAATLAQILALERAKTKSLATQASLPPPSQLPPHSHIATTSTAIVPPPPLTSQTQAQQSGTMPTPPPHPHAHLLASKYLASPDTHALPQASTPPAPSQPQTHKPPQGARKNGPKNPSPAPSQQSQPLRPINTSIFKSLVRLRKALQRPQPVNNVNYPTTLPPPLLLNLSLPTSSSLPAPAASPQSHPSNNGATSNASAPSQTPLSVQQLATSSSSGVSIAGAAASAYQSSPSRQTLIPTILAPQILTPQVQTPQVHTPQTPAPHAPASQTSAPQDPTPQILAPQIPAPHALTPYTLAPQVSAAQALLPEVLESEIPTTDMPPQSLQTPPLTSSASASAPASTSPVPMQTNTSSSISGAALLAAAEGLPGQAPHTTSSSSIGTNPLSAVTLTISRSISGPASLAVADGQPEQAPHTNSSNSSIINGPLCAVAHNTTTSITGPALLAAAVDQPRSTPHLCNSSIGNGPLCVASQTTSSSVIGPEALVAAVGLPAQAPHITSNSNGSISNTSTGAALSQTWHPSAVASFLSRPTTGQNAQLALQAMLQYYQAQVKPAAAQLQHPAIQSSPGIGELHGPEQAAAAVAAAAVNPL